MAHTTTALAGAFTLVHDQYVARRYMFPDPSGLRVSLHHALPSTKVFTASDAGRVVGTVTLIGDSALGLPMDEMYRDEMGRFRDQGRRVTEVSALAIDAQYKLSGVGILARLVRLLIIYAVEVGRHDDICIAVNPRHVSFYRRLFPDSHQFGGLKTYRKVNGAPAVALRIDLGLLRGTAPALQAVGDYDRSAYDFFVGGEDFDQVVARLRKESAVATLTSRQLVQFFTGHPALARATDSELSFIQSFYPEVDLEGLIDRPRDTPRLRLALAPA